MLFFWVHFPHPIPDDTGYDSRRLSQEVALIWIPFHLRGDGLYALFLTVFTSAHPHHWTIGSRPSGGAACIATARCRGTFTAACSMTKAATYAGPHARTSPVSCTAAKTSTHARTAAECIAMASAHA